MAQGGMCAHSAVTVTTQAPAAGATCCTRQTRAVGQAGPLKPHPDPPARCVHELLAARGVPHMPLEGGVGYADLRGRRGHNGEGWGQNRVGLELGNLATELPGPGSSRWHSQLHAQWPACPSQAVIPVPACRRGHTPPTFLYLGSSGWSRTLPQILCKYCRKELRQGQAGHGVRCLGRVWMCGWWCAGLVLRGQSASSGGSESPARLHLVCKPVLQNCPLPLACRPPGMDLRHLAALAAQPPEWCPGSAPACGACHHSTAAQQKPASWEGAMHKPEAQAVGHNALELAGRRFCRNCHTCQLMTLIMAFRAAWNLASCCWTSSGGGAGRLAGKREAAAAACRECEAPAGAPAASCSMQSPILRLRGAHETLRSNFGTRQALRLPGTC